MSEKAATKSDLKSLENRIDLRFEKIEVRFDETMKLLSDFANSVNTRFNKVEERLDAHDEEFRKLNLKTDQMLERLDQHDEEFRKLNEKYDHLIETIDDFVGRINRQDIESVARDHKMARLERWIEQLAKKTGTKLD